MRYDDKDRESTNVEDRRGEGGGGGGGMFGGGRGLQIPIPMGGARGGMSITTLLIIGALMLLFGMNPLDILFGGGGGQIPQMPRVDEGNIPPRNAQRSPGDIQGLPKTGPRVARQDDEMASFVKKVLADTEDVWDRVFKSFGKVYKDPQLVMFSGGTRTACGQGVTAMGPFYCPLDQKVYIDLKFYDEMKTRFHAAGDFAQAYVVAHEVGHHVQTLLGIADAVQKKKQRASSEAEVNQIQVRMELQADCLAGVWASLNDQIKSRLEPGDIEEGLTAAQAIGDDTLQRQATGRVVPDAFTHGSSAQRVRWFKRGIDTGQVQQCDTFTANPL